MARHPHRLLGIALFAAWFFGTSSSVAATHSFFSVSPRPGARNLLPETTIILRTAAGMASRARSYPTITVEGSGSGIHSGDWRRSDDGVALIFKPQRAFDWGENVRVSVDGDAGEPVVYSFYIAPYRAPPAPLSERLRCLDASPGIPAGSAKPRRSRLSAGMLPPDFPLVDVTVSDNPEPGRIFLSNFAFSDTIDTSGHLIILDGMGAPVFFRKMANATIDFKKQPNGWLTYFVLGNGKFHAMDSTYTVVDSFAAGNGYTADFHELRVLPNGHALLLIYDPQPVDMSQVVAGGNPNAIVDGLVVQELDATGNVVFQWRSWDHFQITDTNIDLTVPRVDYVHGNAIELDSDGNLLISSRHLDEITKIDRSTGDVIWRMGGKNNEFTLVGDTDWFSRQHHVRRLPNGNITMFDNGNVLRRSRSVEYAVDEVNKVATLVWQYRNTPDVWGYAMGSSQRLPGGNTFIGWGAGNPTVTEVRPDGSKAFELTLEPGVFSYRAFRFPWNGVAAAPYLWADTTGQVVTLGFDKFGDTDVQKYYVYQGSSANPTSLVDSTTGNSIVIGSLAAGSAYHFRVTAVNGQLEESAFSNNVAVTLTGQTSVFITRFDAIVEDSGVRLSWDVTGAVDVVGFNLYRASEPYYTVEKPHEGMLAAGTFQFIDQQVASGVRYLYYLGAVDGDGEQFSSPVVVTIPDLPAALGVNYPNPFNPGTTIPYRTPRAGAVRLEIYDVQGRRVRIIVDEAQGAGKHTATWDGRDGRGSRVSSGVYFCRLRAGNTTRSRSITILR